jgi:2-methylcitrate dehydratase PrpD
MALQWLLEGMPMSVSQDLSGRMAQAEFRALPPGVVEVAKTVIFDALGVTLAGSVEPPARIVAEYMDEMGGAPQCSLWGHRVKTSPVMAAFANGVAGHVLDYEVMWHPATHATSPPVPGILALAESQSRSGQEVITALVAGFEVQGRIRVASALLDGRIGMETFTDAQIRRPAVAEPLAKTQLHMDRTIPANFDEMRTTVSVKLQDGKEYSARCDRPRGIGGNPLTREERLTKVRQCAARVLPEVGSEQLIEMVEDLEHASSQDVSALMGLLGRASAS